LTPAAWFAGTFSPAQLEYAALVHRGARPNAVQTLRVVEAEGEVKAFFAHWAPRADGSRRAVRLALTGKPVDLRVLATQGIGMPLRTMDELVEGSPDPDQLRQAGHGPIVTLHT
jgi:hypothetical protein